MKKLLTLIVIVFASAAMTGCGEKKSAEAPQLPQNPPAEEFAMSSESSQSQEQNMQEQNMQQQNESAADTLSQQIPQNQ